MEKSTLGTDNSAEKSNINPKCNDPLVIVNMMYKD